MRFEFSSEDVASLVDLISDQLLRIKEGAITGMARNTVLNDCIRLAKKHKMYGQEAYANREEFRDTIRWITEMIESAKQTK